MTRIEYVEIKVRPSYGGKTVEVVYEMTHTKNNYVNKYLITAQIGGLQSLDPHFTSCSAELVGEKTNPETLTQEAAEALFEEYIA